MRFLFGKRKKAEYRQHVMDDIQLLFFGSGFFLHRNNFFLLFHLLFFLFLRLPRGCLRRFIFNLFQLLPIARRFHRILNRNPPIRHARQRVRDDLACPVSDAIQLC